MHQDSPNHILMDQGMGIPSQPLREVNYTLGIDIGEPYVPTEEQLHNFCPETVNHTVAAQPSATKGKRTGRLKNFNIKEDEILCSGWLNVSKDPIVGVNQSSGSYWERITAYCKENNCPRSKSALQHRWADIQKETSKFCGNYAHVERLNRSGKSEGDKLKDAMEMYEGLNKTTFKFMHCWLLLRNEMKWNEYLTSMSGSGSNGEPATEPGMANIDATLPARIERPVGRDKAKKARSNNSSSSACLEVLQKMSMDRTAYEERVEAASKEEAKDIASRSDCKLALQEEQLQVQKTQVQLQKELLELQKEDREERVMNMDVEKMAPWVRDYYINKQKKIAAMSFRDDASSGP